ncbi:MAG: cyclic nucleotide-binding domain-containing protein, partial [Pseudomonadota bacterium]
AHYFKPVEVAKETYLFRQGAPGDCLYLVHSGAAAVVLPLADGQERVIRIYRAGAVLGEMALYTGAPRSANVRIEESGLLFRLGVADMNEMQHSHPAAAGQFHSFIVRLLAERLDRANKERQRYI